ncbi:MAG: hypothetical protein IPK91_15465 [Saprospiraceae bacterium]|nr:hypothetical protein [Saprospiraceae bacterium]
MLQINISTMNWNGIRYGVFCLIALFGLNACKSAKDAVKPKHVELKHWLTLQKYPCFGHCHVYKLSMYRNGLVILEGKEHLEKTGVYFSQLSQDKIRSFKRMSDALNWASYQAEYLINIPDLPLTELTYFDENGAKNKFIKSNSNLPNPLDELTKTMAALIKSEKWTQIQKKSDLTNPEIISDEFIVDMDSTLTATQLENEFYLYDLKSKKRLSNEMNLWSFKYDETKINRYEMLIMLRMRTGIRSVNNNLKILPRE